MSAVHDNDAWMQAILLDSNASPDNMFKFGITPSDSGIDVSLCMQIVHYVVMQVGG